MALAKPIFERWKMFLHFPALLFHIFWECQSIDKDNGQYDNQTCLDKPTRLRFSICKTEPKSTSNTETAMLSRLVSLKRSVVNGNWEY